MSFTIRAATHAHKPDWLRMRQALWPDAPVEYLTYDLDERLVDPDYVVYLAFDGEDRPVAFIEAGLRDYGEGCETSPVGYIEAWYVDEHIRGRKVGRQLVQMAEQWAREKGCSEMGSDTWLENETSIAAHLRLGYQETERLVHFAKKL